MKKYYIDEIRDKLLSPRVLNEILRGSYVQVLEDGKKPYLTEPDYNLARQMAFYMSGKCIVNENGENKQQRLNAIEAYHASLLDLYGEEEAKKILSGAAAPLKF